MLYILGKGGTVFFAGDTPEDMAQAFDLHQIQSIVGTPAGLADLAIFFESFPSFQCGFDHIVSGAGFLTRTLSERLRARMSQNVFTSYGATEVSTVASGPAVLIAGIENAVGYVAPGMRVQIVDDTDKVLEPGTEGTVRIRGPHNAQGYVGDPEQSAQSFRDGWFYPGDIGTVTADGVLTVLGRKDSVLNVGGPKMRAESIEDVAATFQGIDRAAAFTMPNDQGVQEVLALIQVRSPINEAALREHCAARLPDWCVPVRFFKVDRIPTSATGKIERHRLAALGQANLPRNR
jgi:acyl-CoA synthetase (AMP-forming)/AMP-acid ligase II